MLPTIGDQESLDEWPSVILLTPTLTRTRTHGVPILAAPFGARVWVRVGVGADLAD